MIEPFVAALLIEIRIASDPAAQPVETIYFGGGTPSLLSPEQISRIIGELRSGFTVLPGSEITLEMNPKTADPKRLAEYREAGINRITIGMQSPDERELGWLGRIHLPKDGNDAIQWVKQAGFNNFGVDLIYGIPGQTCESWISALNQIIGFSPDHISCYMLTYEPGTPLHEALMKKKIRRIPDKIVSDLFLLTISTLEADHYEHYEISNFARKIYESASGARSRHNQKYWNFSPYRGFGPGAHSFLGKTRFWNVRDVSRYVQSLSAGVLPVSGSEVLTREQEAFEFIYLGLRRREGISVTGFEARIGIPFFEFCSELIRLFESKGLMIRTPESCALTPRGMLFHESISRRFIDSLPPL